MTGSDVEKFAAVLVNLVHRRLEKLFVIHVLVAPDRQATAFSYDQWNDRLLSHDHLTVVVQKSHKSSVIPSLSPVQGFRALDTDLRPMIEFIAFQPFLVGGAAVE